MNSQSGIAVVGSVNMDIVNRVKGHPRPGETVHGLGTAYFSGGKGANQAAAASLNGAGVWMIGAVGEDGFAGQLADGLLQYGVNTDALTVKPGTSGLAFITVDEQGENTIILSAGANGQLRPKDVEAAGSVLTARKAVLLQNEIPWDTTAAAVDLARSAGVRVYFNPAPAVKVPDEMLRRLDVIVVNEGEAETLLGWPVDTGEDAIRAGGALVSAGAGTAVVTLGADGCVCVDRSSGTFRIPAFPVEPADTTAAGDTFIGALCAAREVKGLALPDALRYASAAAALAVTRPGAQSSIPSAAEVEQFLRDRA